MMKFYFNVQMFIQIHVLMKNFDVMDDQNVQMEVMNGIVIVCIDGNVCKEIVFRVCLAKPSDGIPIIVIILIVLAILFLSCVLSTGKIK